ncbi:glycosyltransferase [Candidatus Saccharibacteria bacterium]|nr:glycosyltransferase [Candidatus Saccharibacteria bacterium]
MNTPWDGSFEDCPKGRITGDAVETIDNRVKFRRLDGRKRSWLLTILIGLINAGMDAVFVWWLFFMEHDTTGLIDEDTVLNGWHDASFSLAVIIECIRLINIVSMTVSTILARVPLLLRPEAGLRAALFITFVPSSEDIGILERTLRAAKCVRHRTKVDKNGVVRGVFDIYVLDEQNDPTAPYAVQELIARLNRELPGNRIIYFSRKGIEKYNQKKGPFEAKTKFGNINACFHWVNETVAEKYDVLMGVDPDHAPVMSFGERMLGYFRDSGVVCVVGPQTYYNATHNYIAALSESQQFVFHSLMQPAANAHGAAMMVGTSYAIRWAILERIGGIQASITEDAATTFALLSTPDPLTGKRGNIYYTPDVLAHGDGPDTWGAYFSQQNRWSRGVFELLIGPFWASLWGLIRKPWRLVHYFMLMSFYPAMSIIWIVGAINMTIYVISGASSVIVDPLAWLVFYGWAACSQIVTYTRSRKHNVSPYEEEGSWGIGGMLMSVLASPIYANALLKTIFRRPAKFVVTPKGGQSSGDSLFTFRINLIWGAIYGGLAVACYLRGFETASALSWPIMAASISFAPPLIWFCMRNRSQEPVEPRNGVVNPEDTVHLVVPSSTRQSA